MATAFRLDHFSKADAQSRVDAVERGLPAAMVRALAADGLVTIADIARVVAPRRTLDRRLKGNEPLSVEESDRFARLVRLLQMVESIFGSRQDAIEWMRFPKRAFDGKAPLDLIRTGVGGQLVEEHLLRLKHGFFA